MFSSLACLYWLTPFGIQARFTDGPFPFDTSWSLLLTEVLAGTTTKGVVTTFGSGILGIVAASEKARHEVARHVRPNHMTRSHTGEMLRDNLL